MTIAVVVQARMGSSRLPGKVLKPVLGVPMLQRMVERLRGATTPFELVVATSTEPEDEAIVAACRAMDTRCFRGHPLDCLDRHLMAGREVGAEIVVKIPSDCPLIDPAIVDRVLAHYEAGDTATGRAWDFVSNLHPPTYPDGNDVEVMPMDKLERAHREATRELEREHTTPFFWDRPGRFHVGNVTWETGKDYSMSHRFTVDYAEDHAFVVAVFEALWSPDRIFGLDDILALLEARPEIYRLNDKYVGVNWYRNHLDELNTVDASQTRQV